jgi:hypothetical protein
LNDQLPTTEENLMTTNPATPSEPTEPVAPETSKPATRKPRTPAKSGDPRVDRARTEAVTAKAKAKVTPKAATPAKATAKAKPAKEAAPITTEKGWQIALTRSRAIAEYCKQRTLLHGAGPEAYRKAAAKALDISDEVFEAAFYKAKAEGKA